MTKRIDEIVKRIPQCDTLVDVGCDHGYVSYEALNSGVAKKVVCSDISAPSLEKAKTLIGEKGNYFVADGIPCEMKENDFLVIGGMGGREIMKILSEKPPVHALFQPMKNVDVFRTFLVDNGYMILSDEIVFDGKYYNIIVVAPGKDELTENEKLFGRTNLQSKSSDFMDYLGSELEKSKQILISANGKRKAELNEYIQRITEIMQ